MNSTHSPKIPRGRLVDTAGSLCLIAVAVFLTAGSAALAQTPASAPTSQSAQKLTAQTHPQNPELWDVEQMMDEAVQQISRRYNLNPAQENYTRLLLVGRVREFLDKYEKDVRELLKESIDLRLHPDKGTTDVYKRWAERAEPIYEAARNAILDGNEEWREILNDEQKKLHDQDLAQMKTNFTQVSQVISDWKAGKGSAIGGPGQAAGGVSTQPAPVEHRYIEDQWMAYVTTFIQAYQLDEKQTNAAKAKVHAEFFAQAKNYRERHKDELSKIEAELKSPSRDPNKPTKAPELIRRKGELEKPISKMFVEMDERLNDLLRSEQKTNADAAKKQQLESLYRLLAGQAVDKRQTGGSAASRPDVHPTTSSAPAEGPPGPPSTRPVSPAPNPASQPAAAPKPTPPPTTTTQPG